MISTLVSAQMKRAIRLAAGIGCLTLATGCMDGPFYAMKRMNPYFVSQWRADRELGATFTDRMDELRLLESQLASMAEAEQAEWATRLETLIREDASPEIRARATRSVAKLPQIAAERALNSASADDVEKVRLAACKAWAVRGGPAAQNMLQSLATADTSSSVRQSAVEAMSRFEDREVVRTLATLLDDPSPAVQQQVAASLATLTGEDYGGDFDSWKSYIAGLSLPSSTPGTTPGTGGTQVLPASSTSGSR